MAKLDAATEHAKCRNVFEACLQSKLYLAWYEQAARAFDVYEGNALTDEDLARMKEDCIRPFQHNLIAPRINSVAGKAIQARTTIKFNSRSGKKEEMETADALSGLAMFVQDKNKSMRLIGEAGVSSIICGLGWHTFDVDDGRIIEARGNPLDFVWDVRDRTPYLTNQGFVAEMIWKSREEWKMLFPDKEAEIDGILASGAPLGGGGTQYSMLGERLKLLHQGGYFDASLDEVCVVKMEYRVAAEYWVYVHKNGSVYQTFDKAEAEKNKQRGDTPTAQKGYKVYVCYFAGDTLLSWGESNYQMNPARGDFLATPIVAFREEMTGVPYGLVRGAIDAQNLYNRLLSLAYWRMTHNRVIMEHGAVDDAKALAGELARADALIQVKPGKRFEFESNAAQVQQLYQALQVADQDIQKALGIYDEMMGVETNAKSGVAIKSRQAASQTTITLMFDRFLDAKYRWAEKLLWLARAVFTDNTTIYVLDDEGAAKSVSLNEPVKGADGKDVMRQDIRVGTYDVVVEETMDVGSQQEEARNWMMELFGKGVPPENVTTGLLDLGGISKNSTFRKEIQQGVQQKLAEFEQMKAAQQKLQGSPQGITEGPAGAKPATITAMGSV